MACTSKTSRRLGMQLYVERWSPMHKTLGSIPYITKPLEWVRRVHLKTVSTWPRRKGHGVGKSCWNAYQPCSSASLSCPPTVTTSSQGFFMLLQGIKGNWVCSPNKPWSLFGSRYQYQNCVKVSSRTHRIHNRHFRFCEEAHEILQFCGTPCRAHLSKRLFQEWVRSHRSHSFRPGFTFFRMYIVTSLPLSLGKSCNSLHLYPPLWWSKSLPFRLFIFSAIFIGWNLSLTFYFLCSSYSLYFLLLVFLSCFLVGYLTLFNILSSCFYAIENIFVYILFPPVMNMYYFFVYGSWSWYVFSLQIWQFFVSFTNFDF